MAVLVVAMFQDAAAGLCGDQVGDFCAGGAEQLQDRTGQVPSMGLM